MFDSLLIDIELVQSHFSPLAKSFFFSKVVFETAETLVQVYDSVLKMGLFSFSERIKTRNMYHDDDEHRIL